MNKLDLIMALKKKAEISKTEAAAVVHLFFDAMADALVSGDRVEIRGLCSFYVKKYKSYTGRMETKRKIILALGYKLSDKDQVFPEH